jgi:hypothetical protein
MSWVELVTSIRLVIMKFDWLATLSGASGINETNDGDV